MNRGVNNGVRWSLVSLPDWVVERIAGRLDSGWTGQIRLDVKDGRIQGMKYLESEREPRDAGGMGGDIRIP